jgi:hypothetical protein
MKMKKVEKGVSKFDGHVTIGQHTALALHNAAPLGSQDVGRDREKG